MSATRYGGRKVNDVLVTSNVPGRQETADAEAPAARLRQHRVTGYAALETSISASFGLGVPRCGSPAGCSHARHARSYNFMRDSAPATVKKHPPHPVQVVSR